MDYLVHHGIKGQKWGIRRYQNPDGTLTAAGRSRRSENAYRSTIRKDAREFSKTPSAELTEEQQQRYLDMFNDVKNSSKRVQNARAKYENAKDYYDRQSASFDVETTLYKLLKKKVSSLPKEEQTLAKEVLYPYFGIDISR